MAIALTLTDLCNLMDHAHERGEHIYQPIEFGCQRNLPRKLGEGGDRRLRLRGGLTIEIRNVKLWRTMVLERQHPETFPVTAKFYLAGASRVKTHQAPDIEPDYEEVAGHHYLYHLPELTESEAWRSDAPVQVVMIYADVDYFWALSSTDNTPPCPLQRLMQGSGRFHQPLGKMTLAMTQTLQQILHCPYQGSTRHLYLESKALELLALQFACLEADSPALKQSPLKANDLEQVEYARRILVQRSHNPPSLMELARQVGLNDYKLKQGFRHLFGKTVFGYLRDYRMEQAQHLLHQSNLTVTQVAAQVGYRNPEAFSTAFRRRFGVSPKAYQLGQRG